MSFEKLIRNGKVAVLYSPGYGAGWSTWVDKENSNAMCFDKDIVEAIESGNTSKAEDIAKERYDAYTGGVNDLKIEWLNVGTLFKISEYDGYESIDIIYTNDNVFVA